MWVLARSPSPLPAVWWERRGGGGGGTARASASAGTSVIRLLPPSPGGD